MRERNKGNITQMINSTQPSIKKTNLINVTKSIQFIQPVATTLEQYCVPYTRQEHFHEVTCMYVCMHV